MTACQLTLTTLVVPDYDAGIAFCVGGLGFDLIEDTDMGGGKRWVVVGGGTGGRLLLAKAANDAQSAAIGKQAGGRVGFSLTPMISRALMHGSSKQGRNLKNSRAMKATAR
jgi:catechol 2,3-dioxygenase-like lactoylglutathione lyase family enzyme